MEHTGLTASELGAAGSKAALEHAVREMSDWEILAMGYVREYARRHMTFTAGAVRDYAAERGFRDPPEPRAWGEIMRKSQRERVIEPTDRWLRTTRKSSHGRPERVWHSMICEVC